VKLLGPVTTTVVDGGLTVTLRVPVVGVAT